MISRGVIRIHNTSIYFQFGFNLCRTVLVNGRKERLADFQDAVVTQLRKNELTMHQLGEWAQKLLRVIATAGEYQNTRLRRFGPDVLEWLGTGPAQFTPPIGLREGHKVLEPITHVKRQAPTLSEGAGKCMRNFAPEDNNEAPLDSLVNQSQAVDVSDNEETPTVFHIGESTPRPTSRRRGRAWKEARRSGQRDSHPVVQNFQLSFRPVADLEARESSSTQ